LSMVMTGNPYFVSTGRMFLKCKYEKPSISRAEDVVIFQCKAGQLYDLQLSTDKLSTCPECDHVLEPPPKRSKRNEKSVKVIVNSKGSFYREWPKEEQEELEAAAATNEYGVHCKVCSPDM